MAGWKSGTARAAAGAFLTIAPGAVFAESRLELTTSVNVSASDNPLLMRGAAKSALLAEGTVNPSWLVEGGTAETSLSGTLTVRRYSRAYEKYTYGGAKLKREEQLSEALSYTGSLAYDRSVTVDVVDDVAAAVDPTSLRNQARGDVSIQWRSGPRSQFTAGAGYQRVWFEDATALNNYQSMNLTGGYSRALNESAKVGAQLRAGFNRSKRSSDINILGLMAQLQLRLGEVWTLKAGAGGEYVKSVGRIVTGRAISSAYASGDIEICRQDSRLELCGSAALSSQASGLGTVQRRLSLTGRARYRVGERTTMSLAGSFEDPIGKSMGLGGGTQSRYMQARADISRRISETLTLGAYTSYRRREALDKVDAGYVGIELRWTPKLT